MPWPFNTVSPLEWSVYYFHLVAHRPGSSKPSCLFRKPMNLLDVVGVAYVHETPNALSKQSDHGAERSPIR
jgi:hypothetical protein